MKYNKFRKLGKFGAEVSPIGIGAMSFTNFYGRNDIEESHSILKEAVNLDVNQIDSPNV